MPPKRRTTTARTVGPQRQQATLSFHGKNNKVTKSQSPRTGKNVKKDPALVEEVAAENKEEVQDTKTEAEEEIEESTSAEKAIEEQVQQEEISTLDTVAPDPLEDETSVTTENVLGGRAQSSFLGATGGNGSASNSGWLDDEESRARKVTETQIKKYWRAKELERKAPRVHQEGLTLHEKVLREWDMSGQFGPCIGIARLKRWKRANALGLRPPMEVLGVLLREMDENERNGNKGKGQRAHVDELMSSRFGVE